MTEPNTRDKLLRAASDVACEVGWTGATSRAIAERAGVNLALINYHFRSKDELLLASLAQTMSRLAELPPIGSLDELRALLTEFASTYAYSPEFQLLFQATLRAPHDPTVRSAVQEYLEQFRRSLANALTTLEDSSSLAQGIAALLDGLVLHVLIDPKTDVVAVITSVLDLLSLAKKRA